MVSKTVRINLVGDAEARPVAILVQKASQFDSKVYVETEGKRVTAKSIMGMMSLGLNMGAAVEVEADGTDEEAAVQRIADYLNGKEA